MSIIIDLIIVAIIALCIFFGYKKGLIGVAFKILSFFIALIVAVTLSYPISNAIINNTDIANNISKSIQDNFISEGNVEDENQPVQIEGQDAISNSVLNFMEDTVNDAKDQGVKVLAENLAVIIVRVAVAIGLYIVTRFILFFFRKLAEAIAEIPLIKQFNKAGGLIYGILQGFLIVYVVLAIISLLSPVIGNTAFLIAINNSFIGNFMYNHNLLVQIIL